MKLKEFLIGLPRGKRSEFARRIGIGKVYLSQLSSTESGERKFQPSPALAARIETESGGLVTRQETRPEDWQHIWPELAQQHAEQGV